MLELKKKIFRKRHFQSADGCFVLLTESGSELRGLGGLLTCWVGKRGSENKKIPFWMIFEETADLFRNTKKNNITHACNKFNWTQSVFSCMYTNFFFIKRNSIQRKNNCGNITTRPQTYFWAQEMKLWALFLGNRSGKEKDHFWENDKGCKHAPFMENRGQKTAKNLGT